MNDQDLVNVGTEHSSGERELSPRPALESNIQRDWSGASLTHAYQYLQVEQFALVRHIGTLDRLSAEMCFAHPEIGKAREQLESIEYALHILQCFPIKGVNVPERDAEITTVG